MNQQELLDHINYCSTTGICTWKVPTSNKVSVGDEVGYVSADGYRYFGFRGKTLKLHRAIFLMYYGYLPDFVDHENHDRLDNRITNLKDSSIEKNNRNCSIQKNNTSGVVGVTWVPSRNKWEAGIWDKGKRYSLGRYTDKADAIKARKDAEVLYGYHPNHGS